MIIVDYIQLIQGSNGRASRYEQVTEVSGQLKTLAIRHNVPVVALAQLNREAAKDGRRPEPHELRDSGSLEQDADVILLLHDRAPPEERRSERDMELYVAKQRGGIAGSTVRVHFVPWLTKFS